MTGQDGEIPPDPPTPTTTERIHSTARKRDVDLVLTRQENAPVCLALHGRGATARSFLTMGLPNFRTAATRAGVPPFTIAAVDCGDSYFAPRDGDDPMRMLTDELPTWLADRGLPSPTAALGISMGAFGALRYAREQNTRTVAVAGPALFRSWDEARDRHVFHDERQWAATEPLRHTGELAGTRLGVWCGTEDPFLDAAEDLIAATRPAVVAIGPGAHEDGYFLRVLPDMLRFVGGA